MPPEGIALYLYVYIMAALLFIMELMVFEISRTIGYIRKQKKKEDELDAQALLWLRRIEDPQYEPAKYAEDF